MMDTTTSVAGSDILDALTGIVNAHLADGIADGTGDVHPISVVIWRLMGETGAELRGETALSVIVHVDGMSVAPFGGSTLYVKLGQLSSAATLVVVRAERVAAEELDRLEAEDADTANLAQGVSDFSGLNQAIAELADEVMADIKAHTQKGYAAAYTAFCLSRNIVEDHPLSRRQYRAYIRKATGKPVPEFVKLGA